MVMYDNLFVYQITGLDNNIFSLSICGWGEGGGGGIVRPWDPMAMALYKQL